MAKRKDLLSFLFGESAEIESAESDQQDLKVLENLERFFEGAAATEQSELEAKKTPLAKALSEFGISDADLQLDTEGFALVTDNHEKYVDALTVLGTPDAMHKLAEMGWVVTKPGDVAMTNEPAEYHIRFLEITTVEQYDREPKGGTYDTSNREEVIKKAQEFATTPMDRDDKLNPVENGDGKMSKKNVGLGKAKDGEEPEKAIHDAMKEMDGTRIEEFTSTGSMGTAMSQGVPGAGIVKKPKPYGKGTKFRMPEQWTVKQPVVDKQVKRKVHSESVEQAAEQFLNEDFPGSSPDERGIPRGTFGNPGPEEEPQSEETAQEAYQDMQNDLESGECVVFDDSRSGPTVVMMNRRQLGTIPGTFEDVAQALAAVNTQMEADKFWPNIYHVNDHGNVSLWDGNGNEISSWV